MKENSVFYKVVIIYHRNMHFKDKGKKNVEKNSANTAYNYRRYRT